MTKCKNIFLLSKDILQKIKPKSGQLRMFFKKLCINLNANSRPLGAAVIIYAVGEVFLV